MFGSAGHVTKMSMMMVMMVMMATTPTRWRAHHSYTNGHEDINDDDDGEE